jgi:hypothetical protein
MIEERLAPRVAEICKGSQLDEPAVEDSRGAEALARSRGEPSVWDADDEAAEGECEDGEDRVDCTCGGEVVGGFVGEGSEVEGGCVLGSGRRWHER